MSDKQQDAATQAAPAAIPPREWGRDHYSTFAYICTCVVNHEGRVSRDKMRCNPKLHPGLTGRYHALFSDTPRPSSPTRLKDGATRDDHDDWSCVEDMEAAGLVVWNGTGVNPFFSLTDHGWAVWFRFEQHIAANPRKWSATFDIETMVIPASDKTNDAGEWEKGV